LHVWLIKKCSIAIIRQMLLKKLLLRDAFWNMCSFSSICLYTLRSMQIFPTGSRKWTKSHHRMWRLLPKVYEYIFGRLFLQPEFCNEKCNSFHKTYFFQCLTLKLVIPGTRPGIYYLVANRLYVYNILL